ncbi:MAG: VCBS repeat-containing protein [Deltaproteobacteria bacterium]|nr:VCBS repeat-containing protein [Deltaproteobacteria bacterium]
MAIESTNLINECDPEGFYLDYLQEPEKPSVKKLSRSAVQKDNYKEENNLGRDLLVAGVVTVGVIFAPEITIPLLLVACGSAGEPDEPIPLPPGTGSSSESDEREEEESLCPHENAEPEMEDPPAECVPDFCGGIIDEERGNEEVSPCYEFEEVQDEEDLVSEIPHSGFSIADIDDDGFSDIFVLNNGNANQVFKRDSGNYAEVSAEIGLDFGGDSQDAAWADYDADGDLDLLLVGEEGSNLYQNTDGYFDLLSEPFGIHDPSPGKKAVWLGGGFLLGTINGTRYYRYDGDHHFTESAQSSGLDDPGDAVSIDLADFDGDGDQDIHVANSTSFDAGLSPNRFFQNNGVRFDPRSDLDVSDENCPTDAAWIQTGPGLFPSLYLANYCGGNSFFINQQNGTFVESAGALGVRDPGQTMAVAAADITGDGRHAIFLGRWEQENLIYFPNADGTGYWEAATPLGMNDSGMTLSAEWFDYDNDGLLDLLTIGADGALKLYGNRSHEVLICPDE